MGFGISSCFTDCQVIIQGPSACIHLVPLRMDGAVVRVVIASLYRGNTVKYIILRLLFPNEIFYAAHSVCLILLRLRGA